MSQLYYILVHMPSGSMRFAGSSHYETKETKSGYRSYFYVDSTRLSQRRCTFYTGQLEPQKIIQALSNSKRHPRFKNATFELRTETVEFMLHYIDRSTLSIIRSINVDLIRDYHEKL